MKLSRLAVRMSSLGIAAILVLPFAVDQVQALGNTSSDGQTLPARTSERTYDVDAFVGAAPVLVADDVVDTTTSSNTTSSKGVASPSADTVASASVSRGATAAAAAPSGSEASESVVVFDGRVSRNKKKGPRWTNTKFTPSTSGEQELTLEWSGSGMLQFSIREANSGRWVASNTTKEKPKTLSATLTAGKAYRVAVWSVSGNGTFTVTMGSDGESAPTPPPVDPPKEDPPPADPPKEDPPPATPPAAPPTGNGYPGEPANGTILWGASITGNGDPVARHENATDHPLTIRRTFHAWSQRTGSMIRTASDDVANGRLPWVSIKTPSWTSMAAGDHDSDIDAMLKALDAINGPVWLTIHHEPGGGGGSNSPDDPGGPAAHVEMNRRVRERMTALGTDNIALAPVLMGWAWHPGSGRNADDWWAPGIYDFLGVDHYQDKETSLLTSNWYTIRAWADARGVDIAVGEWGVRGTDAEAGEHVREWYNHAVGSYNDGKGARIVGLSAFDSSLNSPTGSWELKGEQLKAFRSLLVDSRTADPR